MNDKIAEACLKLRANLRGAIEKAHLNLDTVNAEVDMLCLLVVNVTEHRDALVKACEAALCCLPDPDRPADVYSMANPVAVARTVKEALAKAKEGETR